MQRLYVPASSSHFRTAAARSALSSHSGSSFWTGFRWMWGKPASSAVLEGQPSGPHKIQGIGAGFVPANFNRETVDTILPIEDNQAIAASRLLAQKEGLLVGIPSGAALHGALELAKKEENAGKTIVALLPDTGERYLSTVLYAFEDYPL